MPSSEPTKKLLLIGWDAADWKVITPLLESGLMPNLARLIEFGIRGNLGSLRPCLSPILWTSIATGKLAEKHGILGFIEPLPEGEGVRLSSSTSRKTKALWNILSQRGFKTHVVDWYASHPAEPINGVCVSAEFMGTLAKCGEPWPIPAGAVHPAELAEDIARLRVHPSELGLADLLPFIPRLAELTASAPNDPRLKTLMSALAKNASVHAVATAILDAEPWDVLAVYYDAIDVVGHEFMLFHPPRLSQVSERDFDLFHGVMNALYQFHDMMLGRLMQMAGNDAAIVLVSDHGFYSDHLRPATTGRDPNSEETAALWHRHFGVLAMRGSGIKRNEQVSGATLLDIAPTILTMLGLPIGADMDGRVLIDVFERPPSELKRVDSWDTESGPGDAGMHPENVRQDPYMSADAIDQLIALGYLPEPARDQRVAADIARAHAQFNLSVSQLFAGRADLARESLEQLCGKWPDEARFVQWLARCYARLDMHRECRETVERCHARFGTTPDSEMMLAAATFNEGNVEAALAMLPSLRQRHGSSVAANLVAGGMYLATQRWADAAEVYRNSLALEADSEQGHYGLARALAGMGKFEESAEHALMAAELVHIHPPAQYQLGVALEGMGEIERAIQSMEAAVAISPKYIDARRHLARIYRSRGEDARAILHERVAEEHAAKPNPRS